MKRPRFLGLCSSIGLRVDFDGVYLEDGRRVPFLWRRVDAETKRVDYAATWLAVRLLVRGLIPPSGDLNGQAEACWYRLAAFQTLTLDGLSKREGVA